VSTPASAAPGLRFHGTQYDSPGTDNRTNASLNQEWISLVNTGGRAVNLHGYTIRDTSRHVYTFGNVTIAAKGGRIWLHTGRGTNKGGDLYWGSGNYVWNNTGDTAYLHKPSGTTVDTCSWK
jgi:Lamin Tail Domain